MPTSQHMFRLHSRYLLLALIIFLIEVFIALYVHDAIVRPYIGDVLVVILIYCVLKGSVNISDTKAMIAVLLFSYCIELLQYFKMVQLLGLGHSTLANVVLGNTFAWTDILAYTVGIGIVWFAERRKQKKMSGNA